jgi:hypothetical protein
MQLLSKLRKLIGGEQEQLFTMPNDEPSSSHSSQSARDREATRPSYRITDQKWQKIQKAIDQAG